MPRLSHRKKRRRTPSVNTKEESVEKFKDTMGKRRRRKVRQRLDLRKRHPISRQEKQRKTKKEYCFLPLSQENWDKIMSRKKRFEFRRKNSREHVTRIGNVHHLLTHIIFWRRRAKPAEFMLVEFNGLDFQHERADVDYCMRLGKIISTDVDEIHEIAYNHW
jgi:hypothetical protein